MTRKHNPIRMAQRWKLIPTARHKKCVNSDTLCGVYIGNGSKKCPKCNMVQPMKKRKREDTDTSTNNKKKRWQNKWWTIIGLGNTNKVYKDGQNVKIYWEKYDKWVQGKIFSKENDFYTVRIDFNVDRKEGIKQMYKNIDIEWDKVNFGQDITEYGPLFHFYIKVTALHLKPAEMVFTHADALNDVCADAGVIENEMQLFFNNFKDKNWDALKTSFPGIFLCTRNNKVVVQYSVDYGCGVPHDDDDYFYHVLQDKCSDLISKYLGQFRKHENTMHDRFKGLKAGNHIQFYVNGILKVGKILKLFPCLNPIRSSIKTSIDLDKPTTNIHWLYADNERFKPWVKYQFFYEEMGSQRPYSFESCIELNKHLIIFLENSQPNKRNTLTVHKYQIHSHKYEIVINLLRTDDSSVHYSFAGSFQQNIETKVERKVTIHHIIPPKIKELSDYKKDIIRSIGKHHVQWLDAKDASDDLGSEILQPRNVRFIGCTKFKKEFTNLLQRKKFYDNFNIETRLIRRFHGTHSKNLFSILHPLGGFAMATEANGKCYGQGIYFAKSPQWVYENSYAPQGVSNLRCIIVANIICGKELQQSTDTWHRNASLVKSTSSIRYNERGDITGAVLDSNKFELTGGCSSRNIDVVWYDRCKTDINITHVLWYK